MKANKIKINRLLKTARGQIDGILKMIEDNRYCLDVSNQIMATNAILKKANKEIIRAHMESCLKDTLKSSDEVATNEKINEIMNVIDKFSK